ncbi:MAG: type II/IV secretion system ATPase subunit [Nanoarchaeota archaeon]|nr:type II/IV secretion system ATPase subunit [Nanoarchaeota archaeon]
MKEWYLRRFSGFNALEIDCSECSQVSSLQDNKCLDCVNDLKLDFDLLELRKKFSTVYYEKSLSSSMRNDKFHLFDPYIVPLFLNFYVIPSMNGSLLFDNGFYKILKGDSSNLLSFNPVEYNLSVEDLKLLTDLVHKVQDEDLKIKDLNSQLPEDKMYIKALVKSYTNGLGFIDKLLEIKGVQDIYINSPGDSCVFFNHASYGQLSSNLFFKHEMINKVSTFLRTKSGRPFDEAFPVLHSDISGFASRVCSITYPLSFNGSGFAIRKHSSKPFTLHKLVSSGFLSSEVAGFLWFLLDSEVSVLITGPRGSGKTTLLGSLLFEIRNNNRFIVIEDTKELPVPELKSYNFNVEHLRTNSFQASESFELSSETALRTALRLGESVLVIGEVRGEEAKTLFEAMRVGATGNSVIGTIHGSSAFDTFDRIVNDLKVPPTSFKAADVVVSCNYLSSGSAKQRKLVSITEVCKNWFRNPAEENGFFELVSYNPKSQKYSFNDLKRSELLKRIAFLHGWSVRKCLDNIKLRGDIMKLVVKAGVKNDSLLSFESVINQNILFSSLIQRYGKSIILSKFRNYLNELGTVSDSLASSCRDNIILSALAELKAFSKGSAVPSRELFDKIGSRLSRSSFNKLLNILESDKLVKDNGSREWYLNRRKL